MRVIKKQAFFSLARFLFCLSEENRKKIKFLETFFQKTLAILGDVW